MRFLWMPLAKLQDGLGGKAKAITTLVIAGLIAADRGDDLRPLPAQDGRQRPAPAERARAGSVRPWPSGIVEFKPHAEVGQPRSPRTRSCIRLYDIDLAKKIAQQLRNRNRRRRNDQSRRSRKRARRQRQRGTRSSRSRKAQITKRPSSRGAATSCVQRTNADPTTRATSRCKSPLTGIVLTSDFRENLINATSSRNEPLLRIGNTDVREPQAVATGRSS